MTDWFKRINAFIFSDKILEEKTISLSDILEHTEKASQSLQQKSFNHSASMLSIRPALFEHPTQILGTKKEIARKVNKNSVTSVKLKSHEDKDKTMSSKTDSEENLKALKKLRELPRGTHIESRIAAIENLLGPHEVFKTLKMLRWPEGVICPHCHSSNIIKRSPPQDATDARNHYLCLNCQEDGNPSDFDDFSGLPISSVHALRQWILCWYLLGFCSINQIAKVLGLSIAEVIQMAKQGSELSELPRAQADVKSKQKVRDAHSNSIDKQEEDTRSFSKAPTKPGPKSKL